MKQRIVQELEAGHLSLREAAREARTSVPMISKWVDEFGRYKPKRDIVEVVMKSEQARIAALEKALAEAHLTLAVYDELINQANKRFKTDLKKTFGTTSPGSAARSEGSPSTPSAGGSGSRAMPTTNAAPALNKPRGARRAK